MLDSNEIISLDYGSGGKKTSRLIEELLLPAFGSRELSALGDGAVLPPMGGLAFSTDSFVVSPLFFPGGNIGKLCVCGTVNDLCMCGAKPKYLSLSFIIEEGLPMAELEKIVSSIAETARFCGVEIVTGDTKVVEKGRGDGIYINTAGIGEIIRPGLSPTAIQSGDRVIVSGTVGDHGAAVMLCRNELALDCGDVSSDCAPLHRLSSALMSACPNLRVMRDPTRGGLATTLCEFVEGTELCMELSEKLIPVSPAVKGTCDILGLDPLYCANEGKLIAIVPPEEADAALAALQAFPEGQNAALIGTVSKRSAGNVVVNTVLGTSRIVSKLTGAQLPRIC